RLSCGRGARGRKAVGPPAIGLASVATQFLPQGGGSARLQQQALRAHEARLAAPQGALHWQVPHSITSRPAGSRRMVNRSTFRGKESTIMARRATSRSALYSVPHWPDWPLMMSETPPRVGRVHSVYVPGCSGTPASSIGAEVVSCVAASAPVRQAWSYGIKSPTSVLPRLDGRLSSTLTSAAPTVARTVSRGLRDVARPVRLSFAADRAALASLSGLSVVRRTSGLYV